MTKPKKKNKKIIKIVIICVVIICVIGAAIWVIKNTGIGKSAKVYNVSSLNYGFWDEGTSLYGVVTDGKIQKVSKKDALIEEMKVAVGDKVNVGDVLMKYDISSYQIQIKQDEAAIAVLKANINQAQVDIQKYQSLRPYEDAPEPTTEVIDHGELILLKELTAFDLEHDLQEFNVTASTKIRPDFLRMLRDLVYDVTLKVYDDENTLYGYYYISGEEIPDTVETFEKISDPKPEPETTQPVETTSEEEPETETTEEPTTEDKSTYKKVKTDPLTEDWVLDNILLFDGEGTIVDTTGKYKYYGTFAPCIPETYERYEIIEIYPEIGGDEEDYIYSREDLANMVSELQKQISDYELQLRKAEIVYSEDLLTAETGEVLAKIKGVVTVVNDPTTTDVGSDLIVVKGESNYTIQVYVNELDLSNYKVGDEFNIYSYESGQNLTSKVQEIGKEPASQSYATGSANPNSSYYPLITVAENSEAALTIGEMCSATPITSEETSSDIIYLPLMYVRTDNNGSYVMKAVDGKLKKQYVKTGKNFYGSAVEIKEGLSGEDYIAFPYDTGEREGITAVISDEVDYY